MKKEDGKKIRDKANSIMQDKDSEFVLIYTNGSTANYLTNLSSWGEVIGIMEIQKSVMLADISAQAMTQAMKKHQPTEGYQ